MRQALIIVIKKLNDLIFNHRVELENPNHKVAKLFGTREFKLLVKNLLIEKRKSIKLVKIIKDDT